MTATDYTGHTQGTAQVLARVSTLAPELVQQVQELALMSKAENTRRAYQSDWSRWQAWCECHRVTALPASPESVAAYCADHAGRLRVSTLSRHLASISKAHQLAGHQSPCRDELVRATLAGLRRQFGSRSTQAAPILAGDLCALLELIGTDSGTDLRDRALLLTGWCAALRRSELAALQWGDLAPAPGGLVLTLRHSKTDHAGTGQQVALPQQAHPGRCPVAALEQWRSWLLEHDGPGAVAHESPVLRRISRHGSVLESGLSGQAVGSIISRRAQAAGRTATGHSLRVGLVWSAAQAGVSDSALMQTTRHASVTMLRRYQREAGLMTRAASTGLLA